jgi:hypothetical protein
MRIHRRLLFLLTGMFLVSLPHSVLAQVDQLERDLKEGYFARAERVEIAGVEFRGHKTGPTEFTKCNGETIDIGDKKPTRSGPCPSDGKPDKLYAFEGAVVKTDMAQSTIAVKAADGQTYDIYLPAESKEIVSTSPGAGLRMNQVFASDFHKEKLVLRNLRIEQLTAGDRVVIVMVLPGRAEAILRPRSKAIDRER